MGWVKFNPAQHMSHTEEEWKELQQKRYELAHNKDQQASLYKEQVVLEQFIVDFFKKEK